MTQETEKLAPNDIRTIYNSILDAAGTNNRELSEMVKVIDLGDTKKIIIEAMGDIQKMSRQKGESAATRWLRKFGMGKVIDKVKDDVHETIIEGSSVAEVSQRLLDAVVDKRNNVSSMVDKLFDLKTSMLEAHASLKAIVGGIDEYWDQYNEREQFHLLNLKSEVLETMSFHEDNILSADGTIRAAEQATTQISQMIPKLRSQINDSMIIRGSLNELEELTSLCETIGEACGEIRAENRDKMEETLMNVLNQSVVSDKQIALIDRNSKRQIEIQRTLTNKIQEIHKTKAEVVNRLQSAVERNSSAILLASNSPHRDEEHGDH
ncbi:MAG: hypothetical protein ACRCTP_04045 [Aeromonas popoffii]|uniref:hypothetical protein n=1 Tax=Aeromonas popoffii TaxID=70856 RepID=UPI003F355521